MDAHGQQQQQSAAADPSDMKEKQSEIGQATTAPAGSLSSYEAEPKDEGICKDCKYKYSTIKRF